MPFCGLPLFAEDWACLLQIKPASVVSPAFAVETLTATLCFYSLPFLKIAVETPVAAYSLDVDACSPSCGETLLLPLSVILYSCLAYM